MASAKSAVKSKIDNAAASTKKAAGKVIDKGKEAARSTGRAVKRAGSKIRNAGK